MNLGRGEPAAGPWRVESTAGLVQLLRDITPDASGRPRVIAIDGRSASGKTTVANTIHAVLAASAVVHTDDVAWNHSFFGWTDLIVEGVLEPVRRGDPVSYRPPAWEAASRADSIEVPAGLDIVVVEGVGAARRELMPLLDGAVWIQSDAVEAQRRGIARDGGDEPARAFWHQWQSEEEPFLADDRPWERADVIVAGTQTGVQAPAGYLVIAEG